MSLSLKRNHPYAPFNQPLLSSSQTPTFIVHGHDRNGRPTRLHPSTACHPPTEHAQHVLLHLAIPIIPDNSNSVLLPIPPTHTLHPAPTPPLPTMPPPHTPPLCIHIPLFLLLLLLPPTLSDMNPRQIPGTYTNIQLIPSTGFCPDQIRISQVEPLQTADATLFIIPHQFITLPILPAGLTPCTATPITPDQSTLFNTSATVLYRSSQIPLPENFDIIAQFRLASEQFFLAQEVGPRICGLNVLPSRTVSMWMAPDQQITANIGNQSLTFVPAFKYIFYFPESRPCLYRGNAAQVGTVVAIPSRTPTPSPSFVPSPSSVPTPSTSQLPSQSPVPSVPLPPSLSSIPVVAIASPLPTEAPVCFAGGQRVRKEGGELVRMEHVEVGDRVLVDVEDGWEYSQVFAWTHKEEVGAVFVRIETDSGRAVEVTVGHYVWVNGLPKRAGQVRVGDWMVDEIWGRVHVTWVGCVFGSGLYNPQTVHGNLVVEGLVVTTYSSVVKEMGAAHALLAPLRFFERGLGGMVARVIEWLGVERGSVG